MTIDLPHFDVELDILTVYALVTTFRPEPLPNWPGTWDYRIVTFLPGSDGGWSVSVDLIDGMNRPFASLMVGLTENPAGTSVAMDSFQRQSLLIHGLAAQLEKRLRPETLAQTATVSKAVPLPPAPPRPGENGYTLADLLDWWYRGGRTSYPHLNRLADEVSIGRSTIYNYHSDIYKPEFGEAPMPDHQSRFR